MLKKSKIGGPLRETQSHMERAGVENFLFVKKRAAGSTLNRSSINN